MFDHTIVLYGSGAGTTHNSHNLPTLIAGGATRALNTKCFERAAKFAE